MKRQDQKEPKQATTAAELEQQATELAKRLSALEAEERALDGLADFERVTVLAGQRVAIAKALGLANERIGEARKAEKQAAEARATERKLAAIGAARSEVRSIIGVLQHLDQSVMLSFDAALAELYAAGAWLPEEVATITRFRRHLAGTLETLGRIDPVLIGKPHNVLRPLDGEGRRRFEAGDLVNSGRAAILRDAILERQNTRR